MKLNYIIAIIANVSAIKILHPDVPKKPVSRELAADQLGWAGQDQDDVWRAQYFNYNRVVPENFSNLNNDDRFMNSMIGKYAIEKRGEDSMPNGQYYLDETQARSASEEVAKTHLHIEGDELKRYMEANFWDTWRYYDTAKDGKIDAEMMPTFMRYFTHNANLEIY